MGGPCRFAPVRGLSDLTLRFRTASRRASVGLSGSHPWCGFPGGSYGAKRADSFFYVSAFRPLTGFACPETDGWGCCATNQQHRCG